MGRRVSRNTVAAVVTIFFACLSLIGTLCHEIWMDEAHHWLLGRDSKNLFDLWQNTRYEGHPLFWNVILFAITRFTYNPLWMQLAHWIISIAFVLVFIRYSPLPLMWNILFVFGYFTLYEYAVISRNYGLLVLMFLASIHFYIKKKYIAWGVALFALANTHLFGLIIATWLVISSFLDVRSERLDKSKPFQVAILIFILGFVISAIQILPPGDSPFRPQVMALLSTTTFEKLLAVPVRGFLPIPDFSNYNSWNSNLITAVSKPFAGVVSLILGLFLFLIAGQKKKFIIFFGGVFLSIVLVIVLLYPASVVQATRHYGVTYIAFIGALWLSVNERPQNFIIKIPDSVTSQVVVVILLVQLFAGLSMLYLDIQRPFSEAKNVVAFLDEKNLSNGIVTSMGGPIPSISCYLGKKTYSLSSGTFESYYKWNKTIESPVDSLDLTSLPRSENQAEAKWTLVTQHPMQKKSNIILLKEFTQGMIKVENYYVYNIIVSDND
jgi:hypothetical protein